MTAPSPERRLIKAAKLLLTTAKLLWQNAERCAVNHHALDFEQQGLPGWLATAKADIDEAQAAVDALAAAEQEGGADES